MIARKPNQRTLNYCARCKNGVKVLTNVVITLKGVHVHLCDGHCKEYQRRLPQWQAKHNGGK